MAQISTIEKLQEFINNIDPVSPGQNVRFTEASTINDYYWQGDLRLRIVECIPKDFIRPKKPSVQLVKGNTQGSKHVLDSLSTFFQRSSTISPWRPAVSKANLKIGNIYTDLQRLS